MRKFVALFMMGFYLVGFFPLSTHFAGAQPRIIEITHSHHHDGSHTHHHEAPSHEDGSKSDKDSHTHEVMVLGGGIVSHTAGTSFTLLAPHASPIRHLAIPDQPLGLLNLSTIFRPPRARA